MWTGVSGAILVVLCIALYFKMQPGAPDSPTSASSEQNLVKQTLPDDLPTLVEIEGGEGSIGDLLRTVSEVQTILRSGGFEQEKAEAAKKVIAGLKAASTGTMAEGLLDKRIPEKRFDSPQVKKDLQALTEAVSTYVDEQKKEYTFGPAREAAFSLVLLGKQAFERNTRLKSREAGLAMMTSGLSQLSDVELAAFKDGAIDQDELVARNEKIMEWNDAVKAVQDVWQAKLKTTEGVASKQGIPNTADLKKIALEDEDPTFRIYAALRLGYAVYERGDPGNQAFIAETLELLKTSDDKAVAAAAKEGASIEREEYHELRN